MPRASIIVPVYNGSSYIADCLLALEQQTVKDFEVIVADDGSTDTTANVVESFVSARPRSHNGELPAFKLLKLPHGGPAAARNAAVKSAEGQIVLFTDSDCVPDRDWVERMLEPFIDPAVTGVSGTYRTLNSDKLVARFTGYEIAQRHARMAHFDRIDFIGTAYAGYRKNMFEQFGGFDTSFKNASGEDPDLSFRISAAGNKLVFQPRAIVAHRHPDSLRTYLRQKFWRAYWRVRLYGRHPAKLGGESYTPPLLIPQAALTAATVPAALAAPFLPAAGYLAGLCLFLALAINAPFYVFVARSEPLAGLASIPLTLLRNLSFAAGAAAGLLRIK